MRGGCSRRARNQQPNSHRLAERRDTSMSDLTTMAANGALPVSTRERQRFIPAHYYEGGTLKDGAPVYLLAPLTVTERRALNREVVGTCGMFVTTKEIRQALRDGA